MVSPAERVDVLLLALNVTQSIVIGFVSIEQAKSSRERRRRRRSDPH
jgi:hypothetical protein